MEECLRILNEEPETPLDQLLVYQARLQQVDIDIPAPAAYVVRQHQLARAAASYSGVSSKVGSV